MDIPKEVARPFIAGAMIVGSFVLYYAITRGGYDSQYKDIVNIIVGALVSNLTTIVAFYFGSSSSSEEKTQIMADSMRRSDNAKTGNGKNPQD